MKEQDPDAIRRRPLARVFGESRETRLLLAKAEARTAGDAMTSPAITIDAAKPVHAAAALMIERRVNRLPVTDDDRLVGIVTRADLIRTFVRSDEELADAIRPDLLRALWVDLEKLTVEVADGVVAIRGQVERRATVDMMERVAAMTPGVVGVTVDVSWAIDDSLYEAPGPDYFSPKSPS